MEVQGNDKDLRCDEYEILAGTLLKLEFYIKQAGCEMFLGHTRTGMCDSGKYII